DHTQFASATYGCTAEIGVPVGMKTRYEIVVPGVGEVAGLVHTLPAAEPFRSTRIAPKPMNAVLPELLVATTDPSYSSHAPPRSKSYWVVSCGGCAGIESEPSKRKASSSTAGAPCGVFTAIPKRTSACCCKSAVCTWAGSSKDAVRQPVPPGVSSTCPTNMLLICALGIVTNSPTEPSQCGFGWPLGGTNTSRSRRVPTTASSQLLKVSESMRT